MFNLIPTFEGVKQQYLDRREDHRNKLIDGYNEVNEIESERIQTYREYAEFLQTKDSKPRPFTKRDDSLEFILEEHPTIIETVEQEIKELREEKGALLQTINEINQELGYKPNDTELTPEPYECCNQIWCECFNEIDNTDWEEYDDYWQRYCDELTEETEKYYK